MLKNVIAEKLFLMNETKSRIYDTAAGHRKSLAAIGGV